MGFKDINMVCPEKLPTENVLLKIFHFNFSTLVQLVHKWVHCLPIISDYFVLVLKRLFLRHYLLIKQKRLIVNTLTQTSVTRGQSVSTCQLFETSVHCIIVQSFCFVPKHTAMWYSRLILLKVLYIHWNGLFGLFPQTELSPRFMCWHFLAVALEPSSPSLWKGPPPLHTCGIHWSGLSNNFNIVHFKRRTLDRREKYSSFLKVPFPESWESIFLGLPSLLSWSSLWSWKLEWQVLFQDFLLISPWK